MQSRTNAISIHKFHRNATFTYRHEASYLSNEIVEAKLSSVEVFIVLTRREQITPTRYLFERLMKISRLFFITRIDKFFYTERTENILRERSLFGKSANNISTSIQILQFK